MNNEYIDCLQVGYFCVFGSFLLSSVITDQFKGANCHSKLIVWCQLKVV